MATKAHAETYLTAGQAEAVRRIRAETGILTVRDMDPTFRWCCAPWAPHESVRPGFEYSAVTPSGEQLSAGAVVGVVALTPNAGKPDPNRTYTRDIEIIEADGFPEGVPVGCFRVRGRAQSTGAKFELVDTVYDITKDEKKRLRHYLEGKPYMTPEQVRKDEIEKERARQRAASAALDPAAAARETGKAMAAAFVEATKIAVAAQSPVAPKKGAKAAEPEAVSA